MAALWIDLRRKRLISERTSSLNILKKITVARSSHNLQRMLWCTPSVPILHNWGSHSYDCQEHWYLKIYLSSSPEIFLSQREASHLRLCPLLGPTHTQWLDNTGIWRWGSLTSRYLEWPCQFDISQGRHMLLGHQNSDFLFSAFNPASRTSL